MGTLVNDDRWAARLTRDERAPDKQGLLAFAGLPIGTPARDVWFPADESLARAPLQRRVGKAVGPPHAPLALIGTSYSVGEHFLAYLRVLGTTAVRNGARKGFPVHDSLRIDLRQPQRPSPVVLVEMMTYAMGPNLEHEGALSFMGNQFGFLSALEGRRGPSILPEGSITDRPSGADVRRLSLDAGKLLTTADGIVSLRLQRPEPSLPDAPASAWNVVVRGGDLAWGVRWPADAPTFHIPLIGSRSGAHGYTVDLLGPGAHALDPNDVRVVLEHDLQAAAALTGDPLEVTPSGDRIQWFPMAATGPLGDDLALDYRQGNWAGDVRFEWVEAEGAAPIQIASAYLEARGPPSFRCSPSRPRTQIARITTAARTSHSTPPRTFSRARGSRAIETIRCGRSACASAGRATAWGRGNVLTPFRDAAARSMRGSISVFIIGWLTLGLSSAVLTRSASEVSRMALAASSGGWRGSRAGFSVSCAIGGSIDSRGISTLGGAE